MRKKKENIEETKNHVFKRFKDTIKFSPSAEYFKKFGRYCDAMEGTPAYVKYWEEERRRCLEGYEVDSVRITGPHYFYLNFNKIKIVDEVKRTKYYDFPHFFDGDYEFYWSIHIARYGISEKEYKKLKLRVKLKGLEGGKHVIVTKARRKGYSYKNASLAAYNYTFKPGLLTLILASEKKYLYPDAIMTYTKNYLNFLDTHTAFKKERLEDSKDYIKAGYKEDNIEKGTLSSILALSMDKDADKARGKDADLILFEEGGTLKNLEECFSSTSPSVSSGTIITGQIIVFGTGGNEMKTQDFAKMFFNPDLYEFQEFENIWELGQEEHTVGFFHPSFLNAEGFNDKDGNSDSDGAKEFFSRRREKKKSKSKDKKALTQEIIEYPFTPSEVFAVNNHSVFPTADLLYHYNEVTRNRNIDSTGIRGFLTLDDDGKAIFKKDDNLEEVEFPVKRTGNQEGCLVIYEMPMSFAPNFMYIGGLDPYAQDNSETSNSSGSIMIYKRAGLEDTRGDRIVAEYTGRPSTIKEFNENVRRLLLFYNATLLYENQINNIKEYFENKNCVYLLADTPTILKATINTTVRRGKGIHMTQDIKNELELFIRDWLLDINSEGVPNYKFIYSEYLLKELIHYKPDGNFDRIIALMMCILYKLQLTKLVVKKKEEFKVDPFFSKPLFTNRSSKKLNGFF